MCEIVRANLDKCAELEALSKVWGILDNALEVVVPNHKFLLVAETLHGSIKALCPISGSRMLRIHYR